MHFVFLSHTHKDVEAARRFESALYDHAKSSLRVWRTENLPIGVDWQDEIQRRLHAATAFIPLITENYLASVTATVELGRMIEIRQRHEVPLIPVMFDPVTFSQTPASQFKGLSVANPEQLADAELMARICEDIFRTLDRWQIENSPIGTAELFLAYRILEPAVLSGVLQSLAKVYHLVYRVAADIPKHVKDRVLFSKSPEDRLIIGTAETGDSIKLKLKTGWLPSFDVEDGDLVVSIPRGALSLAATALLASSAINSGTSSVKNVLDIQKGGNDIRIQQLQEEKLQLELKELRKKIESDADTARKIDRELRILFRLTVQNDDIFSVKLSAGGSPNNDG